MNRSGKDGSQLNELEKYLRSLNLFENRNLYPNPGFSLASVRYLSYDDVWKTHVKNHWYDIRLDDNSLLFFYQDSGVVSYSFLGCPFDCESFGQYKAHPEFDEIDEELLFELYEDYVASSALKANPYYFRYDYDEGSYREGEHPVAHLHCGLMDNVRIGLIKGFDIMSFGAFILRQVYTAQWSVVLKTPKDYYELHMCKNRLNPIDKRYYLAHDKERDFYLV